MPSLQGSWQIEFSRFFKNFEKNMMNYMVFYVFTSWQLHFSILLCSKDINFFQRISKLLSSPIHPEWRKVRSQTVPQNSSHPKIYTTPRFWYRLPQRALLFYFRVICWLIWILMDLKKNMYDINRDTWRV